MTDTDKILEKMELEEKQVEHFRDSCERSGRPYNESPGLIYYRARLMGMIDLAAAFGVDADRFKWVYNLNV